MKILITAPYHETGRQELERQFGTIIYKPWKEHGRGYNEDELITLLREASADAFITEHDRVTEAVIRSRPNLRFIGVCRGTPSNVAVETAKENNIPVFNTPGRNAQAVAEMFISNVIWLMRKSSKAVAWLESGRWEKGTHTSYLQFKGNEMAGKTLGIVGFGAIGQRIANMVRNFPCKIQYYDPFVTGSFPDYKQVSLEELFSTSDVVSIHLPVNEYTKGMIDRKLFGRMQPHAIFVNTSRAAVVIREDLLDILGNQKIKGAVLDVFDNEPPDEVDYELIRRANVLATPHIAGATHEVEDHHVEILNRKLVEYFSKKNSG